ncbi:BGTF surface domain-containing protein [Natrinema soli]|uniref:BGTF surface domain-containing protein n=1 Tax=Natrinema soli TaxID=1930624 RepID=A0ABD5SK88_9EURY|nr:BGTF surface domain-containing protein [Natrinema soli]
MTNETTYRDKGRAVVLAALMVLSVVAMTVSFTGAAAAQTATNADATIDANDLNGDNVWIGQQVNITNLQSPADLTQGGDVVKSLRVNDGSAMLDTSDLSAGRYNIEVDGSSNGSIWINEHEISTGFNSNTVVQGGNAGLTYEDVSDYARRSGDADNAVEVSVTGEYEGENLSDSELAAIFDNADAGTGDAADDNAVLLTGLNNQSGEAAEENIATTFGDSEEAGNYSFTFDVTDTTASDTAEITVVEQGSSEVNFGQTTYQGVAGDNVEIDLDLTNTNNAYLNLTHEGTHVANINVSDVNEEDVTVVVDTYNGEIVKLLDGDGEEISSSDYDAANTEFDWATSQTALPAVEYDLEAQYDPAEDVTDGALLILNDRSTDGITTHVAPSEIDYDSDNPEDFLGSATERDYVASGDYLITQVEATGIYSQLQATGADSGLNSGQGLSLTYERQSTGAFDTTETFTLADLDDKGINYHIYEDADNGTFYVIFNTADLADVSDEDYDLSAGEEWNAEFEVNGTENAYVDEDEVETVDTDFDVEAINTELTGEFNEDDRLQVSNSAESEISAQTNLAPGTTADYYVRFQTEVYEQETTVGEDGMISATFDFSDRSAGDELKTVRVSPSIGDAAKSSGIIVASEPEPEANISIDGELTSSEVQVGEEGELVVTVTNSGDAEGTVDFHVDIGDETITQEQLTLAAGEDVTRTYTDFNTSEAGSEISWEAHAGNATDEGALSVVESDDPGNSDDSGSDDSGSGDSGSDDSGSGDSGSDDSGSDSDDDGTPGFGVGVALVALLGAAMLALRRQN